MFTERFQRWWWVGLLIGSAFVVLVPLPAPDWVVSPSQWFAVEYAMFLVLIVLLLVPLFSEISVLGIGVKRELRALQQQVKRQAASNRLYWLGNDLASLRFQAQVVRPFDENKRLVSWQGQQALQHARASKVPQHLVDQLDDVLQTYLSSPGEEEARDFADGIMKLQVRVAGCLAQADADESGSHSVGPT